MRPDLRTFRVNNHYLIGVNLGLRVIILRPDASSIAYDIDWQANADDNFSLSQDGGLLAGAFSSEAFCCVEVIDLRRGSTVTAETREDATILRLERVYALSVRLAPNGETLFYWKHGARKGTYAVHVSGGQPQKIPNASAVFG